MPRSSDKEKLPPEPLDLAHTIEDCVVIKGVPVRFWWHVNAGLISVGADNPNELVTRFAIDALRDKFAKAALEEKLAAKEAQETRRTETSAEARRKAAQEHWSTEWLARAHQENPGLGAGRLALRARQMHVAACEAQRARQKLSHKALKKKLASEAKKRDEINKHRAREYLKTIRNKPDGL